MRYLIANGLYITSEFDNLTYVSFEESEDTLIEIDNISRQLIIKCPPGTKSSSLNFNGIKLYKDQLVNFKKFPFPKELLINGIRFTLVQDIINGHEVHLKQYLLNNIDKSTIDFNVEDKSIYIVIRYEDYDYYNNQINYIEKLNELGLLYCEIVEEHPLTNIYDINLSKPYLQINNYKDVSPANLTEDIYINETDVISSWVMTMMKAYPEIDFFINDDLMNLEKHEHVKYTAQLMPNVSQYNSIHVNENPISGRWWKGTIPIQLEYIIDDLPTLLTKKDHYRLGYFFNDVHEVVIEKPLKNRYNKDGSQATAVYTQGIHWDRDNISEGYNTKPSTTNNDVTQFSFTFSCMIFATLIEKLDTPVSIKYPSYIQKIINANTNKIIEQL